MLPPDAPAAAAAGGARGAPPGALATALRRVGAACGGLRHATLVNVGAGGEDVRALAEACPSLHALAVGRCGARNS